jgi:hypothetical protein
VIALWLGIAGLAVLLYVAACAAPALQFERSRTQPGGPTS